MHRPSAIVATVSVLLLALAGTTVGGAVTAAAANDGRLAAEGYGAALATAQATRDEAAEVRTQLLAAMLEGKRAATEATAIVALPAGVLDAASVSALAPLMEELESAMPADTPSSVVAQPVAVAAGTAGLRAAAGTLLDWSAEAEASRDATAEQLAAVDGALSDLTLAIAAAARSVTTQAPAALAAAPIASAETRAAIQPAVTAVREQIRTGSSTVAALQAYSTAIAALSASQAAAAAAAAQAAAEAEEAADAAARERRLQEMRETMAPPPLQNLVCYWDDLGGNYCYWE